MKDNNISSNWKGFHRLWMLVTIILAILLLLLWLLGFGPWRKNCQVASQAVENSVNVEKIVDNPKLLSRINSLETENSKISGLKARIAELESSKQELVKLRDPLRTFDKQKDEITDLAVKFKALQIDNAKIPVLKARIIELEEAANVGGMQSEIKMLKTENEKIAGLSNKIIELEAENKDIPNLKVKLSQLMSENVKIPSYQKRIKELESGMGNNIVSPQVMMKDSSQLIELRNQIKQLETQNQMIPDLQAKITALQNAKPKVVEKNVRVPVAPTAPHIATAPQKVILDASISASPSAKLYFEVNSAKFPRDPKLSLSKVISYLKSHKSAKVVLSGFHDPRGKLSSNQALSIRRANSVAKLLSDAGISSDRIKVAKPRKTEGTGTLEEARRVEVRVVN